MQNRSYNIQKLGNLFQCTREKKNIQLKQATEITKIRIEYLEALEKGDYKKLPPEVYTKGFIRNYSQYLGLDPKVTLALYRREYLKQKQLNNSLWANKKPLKERLSINLTSEKLVFLPIIIGIMLFVIYIITRINAVVRAPEFELDSPVRISAGSEQVYQTTESKINIKGKVEVGSRLKINNAEVDTKNLEIFEIIDLQLEEGENIFTLVATSEFGIESTIVLKVVKKIEKTNIPEQSNVKDTSMLLELIIGQREAAVIIEIDGSEVQNWIEPAGTVKTFRADKSIKIQTSNPDSVRIAINGEEKKIDTTSPKEWVLIDGQVVEKKQ